MPSFICTYFTALWSATYKRYLESLRKLQNKAMRVINNMQWSSNADPLFRKNKILKLKDLVKLETSKLMLNFDRCKLPNSFTKYFKKVSLIHSRVTRSFVIYCTYQDTDPIVCTDLLNIEELKFGMIFHVIFKKIATLDIILAMCTNVIS